MARRPATLNGTARRSRGRTRGEAASGTNRSTAGGVRVGAAAVSAPGDISRGHVAEVQRSRLLLAAVDAIEECGFAAASVAQITARARVSRRTFYDLFDDREACVLALVENVLAAIDRELAAAGLEGLSWRERVRGGLTAILAFFDREPVLARICVVETLHGGPRLRARREAALAQLAHVLDEGRGEGRRGQDCTALTAEGLVGAAAAIVHARLARGGGEPLLTLAGELTAMLVLPYLGSAAARSEQARPTPTLAAPRSVARQAAAELSPDPLRGLGMRVTYRTARVLQGVSLQPGASNRALADAAGIKDQGQGSKLLARLERLGLIANAGEGHEKGEPNAWSLTALGERVAQRLGVHIDAQARVRDVGDGGAGRGGELDAVAVSVEPDAGSEVIASGSRRSGGSSR